MIIVEILGGLGNQMFQYAFARALSERSGVELKLDITGFSEYKLRDFELGSFNIIKNFATSDEIEKLKRKSFFNKTFIKEKSLKFNKKFLKPAKNKYFQGYWQCEKYFEDIKDTIRTDFIFNTPLSPMAQGYLDEISAKNSVALHIRRGDYVANALYNTDLVQYYKGAIEYIAKRVENAAFFIFSDDITYAAQQFPDFKIVKNLTAVEDMRLMSMCKHNIIANSSFSWWAAWLNNNPEKITTAPLKWFNTKKLDSSTIVPKNWVCF